MNKSVFLLLAVAMTLCQCKKKSSEPKPTEPVVTPTTPAPIVVVEKPKVILRKDIKLYNQYYIRQNQTYTKNKIKGAFFNKIKRL